MSGLGSSKKKTLILFLNMGGPETLEDIPKFLQNIFEDKDMIQLPFPMNLFQKQFGKMVSIFRSKGTRHMYGQIGNGSPILLITESLANKVKSNLVESGLDVDTQVVMRYTYPRVEELKSQITNGYDHILLFSQYPHYASATTGSSFNDFYRFLETQENTSHLTITEIDDWTTQGFYIDWWSDEIKNKLTQFQKDGMVMDKNVHVVFSAHGLPQKYVDRGEQYPRRIEEAKQLIIDGLGEYKNQISFHLSYQSKVGPLPWLRPYTDKTVEEISKTSPSTIIMVPLGFVSDHVETLYEIDILYGDLAKKYGVRNYVRVSVPNDDDDYANKVAQFLQGYLEEN